NALFRLKPDATINLTVPVQSTPEYPVFDGTNLWVPNATSNSVSVVRASTGQVIATLTGNGLNGPNQVAFDGQRILVTNLTGHSVALWKAADLTPLGSYAVGAQPIAACSDGINFFVGLVSENLLRL